MKGTVTAESIELVTCDRSNLSYSCEDSLVCESEKFLNCGIPNARVPMVASNNSKQHRGASTEGNFGRSRMLFINDIASLRHQGEIPST